MGGSVKAGFYEGENVPDNTGGELYAVFSSTGFADGGGAYDSTKTYTVVRLVTHLDVSRDDCEHAARVLREIVDD